MSCEGIFQSVNDREPIEDAIGQTEKSNISFGINVSRRCTDKCQDILQCNVEDDSSSFISGRNAKLITTESPVPLNANFQSVESLVRDKNKCNNEDWFKAPLINDLDDELKCGNSETGCVSYSVSQDTILKDIPDKKMVVTNPSDGISSFDLLSDLHDNSVATISCQTRDVRLMPLCDYDASPDLEVNELKLSNAKLQASIKNSDVQVVTLSLSHSAKECSDDFIMKDKSENTDVQCSVIDEMSDFQPSLRDKLEIRNSPPSKQFEIEFETPRDIADLNEFNLFSFPVDSVLQIESTEDDKLNGPSDIEEEESIDFGESECATAQSDHESYEDSQVMFLCAASLNEDSSDIHHIEEDMSLHVTGDQEEDLMLESNQEKELKRTAVKSCNKTTSSDDSKHGDKIVEQALAEVGILPEDLLPIPSDSDQKQWRCPVKSCKRKFPRLSMLRIHLLYHFGIRPYKCEHEGCGWSFYSYFRLKRHKEIHSKKKHFMCPVENCGRRFTTIYNLNTHTKLHERPAEMVCPVESCGAAFQTKRRMEVHLRTHDSLYAPYKCPFEGCGKLYYSSNCLHSHTTVHTHKEEELVCQWEGCRKAFDKPCRLRAHMRTHTGFKPFKCNFKDCGWAFSSASKLKRHQYKHTNERKFHCTIEGCGKSYLRSEHLKEHELTHLSERTFQCPVENCGLRFTAKSSLYVHSKKHISEDDPQSKVIYCCPIENCNRSYTVKASLRQHMMRSHTPVLGKGKRRFEYITLLAANDETGSLEDIEMLSEDGQLTSTDGGAARRETITHILLPSEDGEVTDSVIHGTQDGFTTGIDSGPCFIVTPGNISLPFMEETVVTTELPEERLSNGAARTDLTYEDVCERKKQNVIMEGNLAPNINNSLVEHALNNEVCINDEELPTVVIKDETLNMQTETHQDDVITISNPFGEYQVLVLGPQETLKEFPESTINLKDLQ